MFRIYFVVIFLPFPIHRKRAPKSFPETFPQDPAIHDDWQRIKGGQVRGLSPRVGPIVTCFDLLFAIKPSDRQHTERWLTASQGALLFPVFVYIIVCANQTIASMRGAFDLILLRGLWYLSWSSVIGRRYSGFNHRPANQRERLHLTALIPRTTIVKPKLESGNYYLRKWLRY